MAALLLLSGCQATSSREVNELMKKTHSSECQCKLVKIVVTAAS